MSDGSLIFNTKIDTDGVIKGEKELSSKMINIKSKMVDLQNRAKALKKELENVGDAKVKTKAAENIEKSITKAQDKLAGLDAQADRIIEKKRAEFGVDINDDKTLDYLLNQDKEWAKLQEQIEKTEDQIIQYKNNLRQVNEAAPMVKDTAAYRQKQEQLEKLSLEFAEYSAKLREAEQVEQENATQTAVASRSARNYKQYLNQTIKALKMLASGLGKAYSGLKKVASNTIGRGIQNITKHFRKANSSTNILEKSLRRIKNTLVRMFFFRLVHSPIDVIKDGLGEISKISPEVNKNLSALKTESSYLKNSFAALAAPLVRLVTPAFVNFMDIVALTTDKLARMIAVLTGQSAYTKAVKVQQDYASSIDDTTSSVKNNTKAIEENQKSLAGFDELNVMQDNGTSSDTSENISSSPAFETVEAQVNGLESTVLNALKNQNWNAVGELISDKVNTALQKFKWNKIKKTAKQWAANVANLFNGFLGSTDWNLVGETAAESVNTLIGFVLGFSYTFDWKLFGQSLRTSLVSFFKNLDKKDIIDAFDSVINGLVTAGIELIGDPAEWEDWGAELENSIKLAIQGINWENVKTFFRDSLKAALNFGSGFFEALFDDLDKELDKNDFSDLGKKAAKDVNKIDWEKIFGKDSTIGKGIQVLSKAVIAGFDFIIGFFEEPGTADKLADGFETLISNVPWKEILIKGITVALFDLPAWITQLAAELVADFCEGLATGFENGEDDRKLNSAASGLAKSLGNLIITIVESLINIVINAIPNLILGAIKIIWNLLAGVLSLIMGDEFYNSATRDLWGANSFHFDWRVNLPRLATGTVVPANYGEFLAVLGDNKREPEVVSPISAIKQALREELAQGGFGGSDRPIYVTVVLEDGSVLFRTVGEEDDRFFRSHGYSRFDRRQRT